MTVVLLVIALAAVAGLLRGGSFANLSRLELPGWPLVFVGVGIQALGAFAGTLGLPGPRAWYVAGMVLSAVLVVGFVVRNRRLPGMPMVALGFLLNALVVVLNGAMPVDADALERIGASPSHLYAGADAKHEPLDDDTVLAPLTDVIPVPLPLRVGSNVVSAGDVVLAAGIGVLVLNGMLGGERQLPYRSLALPTTGRHHIAKPGGERE